MKKINLSTISFAIIFGLSTLNITQVFAKKEKNVINLKKLEYNAPTATEDKVFQIFEAPTKPVYAGGPQALNDFITKNIKYPQEAYNDTIYGRVVVKFIIEKDGRVNKAEIVKSVHPLLDAEALNVVSKIPKWKPAHNEFKEPIRVAYTLPVSFINLTDPANKSKIKFSDTKLTEEPNDSIYKSVAQMPQFIGGDKVLMKYLSASVKYPKEAYKNSISGRVFVTYIVEKDGSISNTKVLRSVHPLLDEEALRVVKSMPNWTPGIKDDKYVRVELILPINFTLKSKRH